MNCHKFQEVLPYMIESGGNEEEVAHLQSCSECADLVQDLKHIADAAKLLLPMHDPNPRVWSNIEQSLYREGLLSDGRMARLGHNLTALPAQNKSWVRIGWGLAMAAVILFAVVLIDYHPRLPSDPLTAQNTTTGPVQFSGDDRTLISQVSEHEPDVRGAYEDSLRQVNTYISDAQQAVDQDPEDATAQEYLANAYQQKEMLYQMATARSLQ
jgi:hypothetical protein